MANDKHEKIINETTDDSSESLMRYWSSLTYETAALKLNPIITSLKSPNPNMTTIKVDFYKMIKFLDEVLGKTFPYLSQQQQAAQDILFTKSFPAIFGKSDNIKNLSRTMVSNLLGDSLKKIVSLFEELKKNPESISALQDNLINFEKLLHFLDKVDCCRELKGADFLQEFNNQLINLKDAVLINNLILKYNWGAKDFDFEQFKDDNPNFDIFKLNAIKIFDEKLNNALTHKEINDLIHGSSSQPKKNR